MLITLKSGIELESFMNISLSGTFFQTVLVGIKTWRDVSSLMIRMELRHTTWNYDDK